MRAHARPYDFSKVYGFTVIELIISLLIVSTLLTITLTSSKELRSSNRRNNYISNLHRHVSAARAYAIYHNYYVSLCPHVNSQCVTSWDNDIMIFVDNNKDLFRSDQDEILNFISKPSDMDRMTYSRKGLTFKPTGELVGFTNGSFIYCSELEVLNTPTKKISVSTIGRIRVKDENIQCK